MPLQPGQSDGKGADRRRPRSSTRERLLQAADRIWSERGVHGASLEDIARDAAVTKPPLYYYFADKSVLFTEMVCSGLEQHHGCLRTAMPASSGSRERLRPPRPPPVPRARRGPPP